MTTKKTNAGPIARARSPLLAPSSPTLPLSLSPSFSQYSEKYYDDIYEYRCVGGGNGCAGV